MDESLDAIGRRHGTDKASERHNFLSTYERYVAPLRSAPVSVLELGVFEGASLRMWRDYFPKGAVVGADLSDERLRHADDRISIEVGNCGDADFLAQVGSKHGPFDLVIDDASHIWAHQQTAFNTLFPLVKPGGVFIIEDLHTSGMPRYEKGLGGEPTVTWLKRAVDYLVILRDAEDHDHLVQQWRHHVRELVFTRKSCIVTKR